MAAAKSAAPAHREVSQTLVGTAPVMPAKSGTMIGQGIPSPNAQKPATDPARATLVQGVVAPRADAAVKGFAIGASHGPDDAETVHHTLPFRGEIVAATLAQSAETPAASPSTRPSAPTLPDGTTDAPSSVATVTSLSPVGSIDPPAASRTVTTPVGLAATVADGAPAAPETPAPLAAKKSDPPAFSQSIVDSTGPMSARRPTPAPSEVRALPPPPNVPSAMDDDAEEHGAGALRLVLGAAGGVVVASAIPTLLRDPVAAATWTIPGVIALGLALAPMGHATRALLAFAPALPALAVRAMGCEGHTTLGALALAALLTVWPAALVFRSHFTAAKRGRALVAAALALGALWALLPGGGRALVSFREPWLASHLPALSFFAVASLCLTAFVPGKSPAGTRVWAGLVVAWAMVPALGSRGEQWGARLLDALSLSGLTAIAAGTLAALLAIYAPPDATPPSSAR